MFSNSSELIKTSEIVYPISDANLPFAEYINQCRSFIEERRSDLIGTNAKIILDANSPFELYPSNPIYSDKHLKYGVLLIHGLLDCPFSLLDIGKHLQANGILCRSVLLPGHGTQPEDLINVSYLDWIQTVRNAVQTLYHEVDQIFLIGYSTGAMLSIYQALHDLRISAIVLIAPAIKIKAPVNILIGWHRFIKFFNNHKDWLFRENEIDYTKYISIPFNAVTRLNKLMLNVNELKPTENLSCPTFILLSQEDETISGHSAIDFFLKLNSKNNRLLIYSSHKHDYHHSQIITRGGQYSALNIKHFSHVSVPFSPKNPHYGQQGDYPFASHDHLNDVIFGAYNHFEAQTYDLLYKMRLVKKHAEN